MKSSTFFINFPNKMPKLGEKIRALRKKAGLTLDQLAEQSGASKSTIWELENKDKARPSAERINEIARVFGVTPEFLMDDEAAEPSDQVADEAFFRKYQSLPDPTKQKLQDILKILDREDDT